MKRKSAIVYAVAGLCLGAAVVAWGLRDRRPVLVCLGDSLTSCGGTGGHYSDWLARLMPDVRVIDAGIGGDTLQGGRARFDHDAMRHRPDVLLIALGANDFWQRARPIDELRDDLETMVRQARSARCEVVVASCFGGRNFWEEICVEFEFSRFGFADEIGRMEQEVCRQFGCRYVSNMQVDVKPNRLPPYWDETDHPNRAGNKEVALRLMPALRQALADAARKR